MNEFAVIALSAILASNVVCVAGVGAISLQSEKRNFLYMLVSSMAIIVSVIIAGLVTYILNTYVLAPLNAEELRLFLVSLFSILMAFATHAILKAASHELFFIYEKSYGFPIQTAVTIGVLLLLNYTRTFLMTMFELSMFCVGFLIVQVLFYALYDRLDNHNTLKPARNIPLMLYSLGLVSLMLYVLGTMF